MADGHAHKGGKSRHRPRCAIEEDWWEAATRTPGEVREEAHRRRAKGTVRANGEDDETHARWEGAILAAQRLPSNSVMDGQASPVGAVVGNVRGRADIKGLDVDERIGVGPIEAANDSVGSVPQAKAGAGQELLKGAVVARALRKDAIRAKERVKACHQSAEGGVVAGGGAADAIGAGSEVAGDRVDAAVGRREARGAAGADGDVAIASHRREEEEVNS